MRRTFLVAFAVASIVAVPAQAQRQQSPAERKPYQAVAVTLPAALADAGFETFRAEVAAVAKGRIYAELARLVAAHGFFWDRDFSRRFDRRKPAVDNLAAALRLEHGSGAGWQALVTFATEPTAEPMPARPGIVCAPAKPAYDAIAFDRLMDATLTTDAEWRYPRAEATPVYAVRASSQAAIETLSQQFVRVLAPLAAENKAGTAWLQVVTPSGRQGFAEPGALVALTADRLCYGKDTVGRWQISGFVGGGD